MVLIIVNVSNNINNKNSLSEGETGFSAVRFPNISKSIFEQKREQKIIEIGMIFGISFFFHHLFCLSFVIFENV